MGWCFKPVVSTSSTRSLGDLGTFPTWTTRFWSTWSSCSSGSTCFLKTTTKPRVAMLRRQTWGRLGKLGFNGHRKKRKGEWKLAWALHVSRQLQNGNGFWFDTWLLSLGENNNPFILSSSQPKTQQRTSFWQKPCQFLTGKWGTPFFGTRELGSHFFNQTKLKIFCFFL